MEFVLKIYFFWFIVYYYFKKKKKKKIECYGVIVRLMLYDVVLEFNVVVGLEVVLYIC